MDNLGFVKLPSEVLPVVTGNNVVIAETKSGKLYWCDSNGAKQLSDIDTAFPVGTIIERGDEVSPASYLLGTWERIAQGRVVIGASAAYPLDSEGGANSHYPVVGTQDDTDTVALVEINNYPAVYTRQKAYSVGFTPNQGGRFVEIITPGGEMRYEAAQVVGNTKNTEMLPPYIAKNIWQRIA